jgi:hypothetical protein
MQQDSDGRNLASADSRANPPTDHESPDELDDWDDDWDENDDDYENDDHEGPDGPDDWNPVGFGAAASISRDAYLSYTKEKKRLKNAKDKAREKEKKAAVKAAAMVPPAETVPSVKPSSSKSISVSTVSCAESTEAGRFLKNTPASLTSTTMGKLSAPNTQTTLSAPVTGSALSAKSSNSKSTAVNAATVSCADSTDGGLPLKNTMASLTTTTHDEHSELLSRLMATNLSLRAQPLTRPSRGV